MLEQLTLDDTRRFARRGDRPLDFSGCLGEGDPAPAAIP
jgi:hypothetical protein